MIWWVIPILYLSSYTDVSKYIELYKFLRRNNNTSVVAYNPSIKFQDEMTRRVLRLRRLLSDTCAEGFKDINLTFTFRIKNILLPDRVSLTSTLIKYVRYKFCPLMLYISSFIPG
jgi:hypothetical protein